MSFTQDLKAGVEIEEQFVEFLKTFKIKSNRNSAQKNKELALYDICDSDYRTYEVKFDRKAQSTGNVFLEHESILRSTSHFIVFKLEGDENFYINDRKNVILMLDNPQWKQKWGGTPQFLGTLVPLEDFKTNFQIFSEKVLPPKLTGKKKVSVTV